MIHPSIQTYAEDISSGRAGRGTVTHSLFVEIAGRNGYHGHPGGYIKNDATGGTVAHGWSQFARRVLGGTIPLKSEATLDQEAYAAALAAAPAAALEHPYTETAARCVERGEYGRALAFLREAVAVTAAEAEARAEIERRAAAETEAAEGQVRAWFARHATLGTDVSRQAYATIAYRDADEDEARAEHARRSDDEVREVTAEDARAAWGRVWAGRATEIADLYEAGDYAGALALATRAIAEQDAETAYGDRSEADQINAAYDTLRRLAPSLLADGGNAPSVPVSAALPGERAAWGLPDAGGRYAVQGLPYGVADHRQPLTPFERAAGVVDPAAVGVSVTGVCEVDTATGWCATHRQYEG